ncbi:unnamed protein product [Nesidiocoris tenuis]|uniref:Uncharacterized protein n=1 Tax=Nesidiocoris tenuis TaxID=355587 RepID=A0A6H5HB95_9HEMI|nr:unnamed protein product [Nesidiocoris tenuis]
MTCGYITRVLAEKNHRPYDPRCALVEHLTELNMERVYEENEILVTELMRWTYSSKNQLHFAWDRVEKTLLVDAPWLFTGVKKQEPVSLPPHHHSVSMKNLSILEYGKQMLTDYQTSLEYCNSEDLSSGFAAKHHMPIPSSASSSSSSSSGCDVGFEADYLPCGTIKRKPAKIPLTTTTRQLKSAAVGDEIIRSGASSSDAIDDDEELPPPPPELMVDEDDEIDDTDSTYGISIGQIDKSAPLSQSRSSLFFSTSRGALRVAVRLCRTRRHRRLQRVRRLHLKPQGPRPSSSAESSDDCPDQTMNRLLGISRKANFPGTYIL